MPADGPWKITNETKGAILAERGARATGFFHRFVGLMFRSPLLPGQALHLVPCNGIHTFFMRAAIDAVFLDRNSRVVRLVHVLRPWRSTRLCLSARSVIELPAGTLGATGTEVGDKLTIEVG